MTLRPSRCSACAAARSGSPATAKRAMTRRMSSCTRCSRARPSAADHRPGRARTRRCRRRPGPAAAIELRAPRVQEARDRDAFAHLVVVHEAVVDRLGARVVGQFPQLGQDAEGDDEAASACDVVDRSHLRDAAAVQRRHAQRPLTLGAGGVLDDEGRALGGNAPASVGRSGLQRRRGLRQKRHGPHQPEAGADRTGPARHGARRGVTTSGSTRWRPSGRRR